MRVVVRSLLLSGILCSAAAAAPLSATFDPLLGFPEEQGFLRVTSNAEGTVRSVDNGIFQLDTRGSVGAEFYYISGLSLAMGEVVEVRWYSQTVETTSSFPIFPSDTQVLIGNRSFWVGPDSLYAGPLGQDPALIATLPNTMNSFVFRGSATGNFEFDLNGHTVLAGEFQAGGTVSSVVAFGDTISGLRSDSYWGSFSAVVVPEPCTGYLCALLLTAFSLWRRE